MTPNPKFINLGKDFWANIRVISQKLGYTERQGPRGKTNKVRSPAGVKKKVGQIKIPSLAEIKTALEELDLSAKHLVDERGETTKRGMLVADYFAYRANVLNKFVEPRLMDKDKARKMFDDLRRKVCPKCPLPMNKQKGKKKAHAFFTGIINMLIEANAKGLPCDYDPRQLTTVSRNNEPFRTLARRVDGAFPSPVNPIAVWKIKEYYYTTTFGSRVADGVYESLLDGMELEELRHNEIYVQHCLMIDDHFTWWGCGRSYLCRVVDMLHMGYVDEVLFGSEVVERLPKIVKEWVSIARAQQAG